MIDMMMNTEIFHTLRPDSQLMRKVGPLSCSKFSLPSLALSLVLLVASSIATATTSSSTNSANTANTAVKASANSTTSSTVGLLPADISRIKQRGELVIAMLATDTPPFFYEKKGELVGLEVDLAKSIAQALNVEVRFNREAKSFNEVVDLVAQRRADLGISKLSRTLTRAQMVHFSQPYLTLNHSLVINRVSFARLSSNMRVEDAIRQYSGSLGVISRSSFADFAKSNFPKAKLIEYPNWKEVLKAVNTGEVMAAYRDEFEIKRLLKESPSVALTLRTVTLKDLEDTLGIAVGVNDPTLLAFVNQMLSQQRDKLDIQKVLNALETNL
ncbi:MAG: amino acid ABC transporter substrate-binding protein [Akkermansiaceae bacterium]|nr:amino acid ABC transporter substrate-binding protein [Akkermansiaceae bacterium]